MTILVVFLQETSRLWLISGATWCGPCRMLSPTVDDIAAEYDGRLTVVKCNVDDCEDLAAQYGIRNIPTLLSSKVVRSLIGL